MNLLGIGKYTRVASEYPRSLLVNTFDMLKPFMTEHDYYIDSFNILNHGDEIAMSNGVILGEQFGCDVSYSFRVPNKDFLYMYHGPDDEGIVVYYVIVKYGTKYIEISYRWCHNIESWIEEKL